LLYFRLWSTCDRMALSSMGEPVIRWCGQGTVAETSMTLSKSLDRLWLVKVNELACVFFLLFYFSLWSMGACKMRREWLRTKKQWVCNGLVGEAVDCLPLMSRKEGRQAGTSMSGPCSLSLVPF